MKCSGKHYMSICNEGATDLLPKQTNKSTTTNSKTKVNTHTHVSLTPTTSGSGPVLLKTATAKLWIKNTGMKVNILLDEGAEIVYH